MLIFSPCPGPGREGLTLSYDFRERLYVFNTSIFAAFSSIAIYPKQDFFQETFLCLTQ